jgi:hypothetical protein
VKHPKQAKKLVDQYEEIGRLEAAYTELLAENALLRKIARNWCIAWAIAMLFMVIGAIGGAR